MVFKVDSLMAKVNQDGQMVKSVMIDGKYDRQSHGLKPTLTILLCSWKKTLLHFCGIGNLDQGCQVA